VLRWLLPLFLVVSAHAQPYPDKPLRLVVEIPTLAEKGLPFVRFGWLGVRAGAGTPGAVVATPASSWRLRLKPRG